MSKSQELYAKIMSLGSVATQQVTVPVGGLATLLLNGSLSSGDRYVYIDGILTTFGWTYSSSTNTITFSPARTAGEEIVVSNKTI